MKMKVSNLHLKLATFNFDESDTMLATLNLKVGNLEIVFRVHFNYQSLNFGLSQMEFKSPRITLLTGKKVRFTIACKHKERSETDSIEEIFCSREKAQIYEALRKKILQIAPHRGLWEILYDKRSQTGLISWDKKLFHEHVTVGRLTVRDFVLLLKFHPLKPGDRYPVSNWSTKYEIRDGDQVSDFTTGIRKTTDIQALVQQEKTLFKKKTKPQEN